MQTSSKQIFAKLLKKINTISFLKKSCELKFLVITKKITFKNAAPNSINIENVK